MIALPVFSFCTPRGNQVRETHAPSWLVPLLVTVRATSDTQRADTSTRTARPCRRHSTRCSPQADGQPRRAPRARAREARRAEHFSVFLLAPTLSQKVVTKQHSERAHHARSVATPRLGARRARALRGGCGRRDEDEEKATPLDLSLAPSTLAATITTLAATIASRACAPPASGAE